MKTLTPKQKAALAKNISACKRKLFPGMNDAACLAGILGVSKSALDAWSRGSRTPSPAHLAALAIVFGTTPEKLCGKRSKAETPPPGLPGRRKSATAGFLELLDTLEAMLDSERRVLRGERDRREQGRALERIRLNIRPKGKQST